MMGDPKMMQVMMGLLGIDGSAADKFQVDEEPAPLPKREEPKKQEKKVEPEVVLSPEEQDAKDKRTASDKEKDLGNALYKQRKFEDALVHYDTAFSLDGSNVPVLTNKSAVLFEMEKYQECIQVCQQAADLGRDIFADFKVIARFVYTNLVPILEWEMHTSN